MVAASRSSAFSSGLPLVSCMQNQQFFKPFFVKLQKLRGLLGILLGNANRLELAASRKWRKYGPGFQNSLFFMFGARRSKCTLLSKSYVKKKFAVWSRVCKNFSSVRIIQLKIQNFGIFGFFVDVCLLSL